MTSPILFAGQEDLSFSAVGSTITSSGNHGILVDTTSGHFRSGYARYALNVTYAQNLDSVLPNSIFVRAIFASTTQFWATARLYYSPPDGGGGTNWIWVLRDSSGVARLRMRNTGSSTSASALALETINAAGTVTQLGSTTSTGFTISPAVPDKIDVFVNYAVSGALTVYINGSQIFTFSGNVTTDGQTTLAWLDLGEGQNGSNARATNAWSEVVVATRDTRNMSLVTLAPSAPGNTNAWTNNTTTQTVASGTVSVGTFAGSANVIFFVRTQTSSSQSGQLTSLNMSLASGLTGTTQMAIYSDNGSGTAPVSLLASSATIVNPASGTRTFTVSSGPTILANTYYWTAFLSSASYSANTNTSVVSGLGATQSTSSFPATAASTSTTDDVWMQMNFNQPNVGLSLASDSNPDTSSTALQIQEYQSGNVIPSGSFSILSVVQHTRSTVGSSGPQHIDLAVRTGGSDFFTSDMSPSLGWGLISFNWDTNPNTTVAWQSTDLPAGSTSFNFGYRSNT